MTAAVVAAGLDQEQRHALAAELSRAARAIRAGVPDDADGSTLLGHLETVRVVFDAVDAGNSSQQVPAGPLRGYRTWLYHQLADRRVPRDDIARAAGVSSNAIGGAIKGQRRGRERPAAGNGAEPEPDKERRPRPDDGQE